MRPASRRRRVRDRAIGRRPVTQEGSLVRPRAACMNSIRATQPRSAGETGGRSIGRQTTLRTRTGRSRRAQATCAFVRTRGRPVNARGVACTYDLGGRSRSAANPATDLTVVPQDHGVPVSAVESQTQLPSSQWSSGASTVGAGAAGGGEPLEQLGPRHGSRRLGTSPDSEAPGSPGGLVPDCIREAALSTPAPPEWPPIIR